MDEHPRAARVLDQRFGATGPHASADRQAVHSEPVGRVVVFAKWPGLGQVKTRLAADVGEHVALDFYRQTLFELVDRLASGPWETVLAVSPDSSAVADEGWPAGVERVAQGEGDLGQRMAWFLAAATPDRPVVIVGSDVPEISPHHISAAFAALSDRDLALGPAPDGGYWLIGARSAPPTGLFEGVRWSTPHAREDTERNAKGLALARLEWLEDVDDGPSYRRHLARREARRQRISAVVPMLNEAAGVSAFLQHVSTQGFDEVIVVDGGSQDGTDRLVRNAFPGVRFITTPPGRGRQMNAGTAAATHDILLFLHADTWLPPGAADRIRDVLSRPGVSAGCFRLSFDDDSPSLRVSAWFSRFDSYMTTFGDHGFFMRRATFLAARGFPEWPLLEDVEMRRRLKRLGRFVKADAAVMTSARRFRKEGVLRRQLKNGLILALHALGAPASKLARLYR